MIVIKNPTWFRLIVHLHGSTIERTWRRVLTAVVFSAIITEVHHIFPRFSDQMDLTPFSLTGLALGIFLGFRNNTSYDRFWEGRKLWGQVVNSSRNLTRIIQSTVGDPDDGEDRLRRHRELVHRVVAYVHTLRHHLRGQPSDDDAKNFLPPEVFAKLETASNRPNTIMSELSQQLRDDFERGKIHPMHLPLLEQEINTLLNVQGGCERIKATPIPFSYNVLLHRLVFAYCFGLPFGLVHRLDMLTPIVVLAVAYAFFGLDAVGDEIEDPFGEDPSDLPLTAITRTIEINIREQVGDKDLPDFCQPDEHNQLI